MNIQSGDEPDQARVLGYEDAIAASQLRSGSSLLQSVTSLGGEDARTPEGSRLLRNFAFMAVCFTINMGCVTTVTAVASHALGATLGGYSQAALYGTLSFSSLCLANGAVIYFGPKKCIIINNACVFISMLGATAGKYASSEVVKYVGAIGGAGIGGLGIGLGWAGQGVYFGRSADRFARAEGIDMCDSSTLFGSYFAGIFLGFEVTLKVGSSVIQLLGGTPEFFIAYCALALASTIAMFFVADIPDETHLMRRGASVLEVMGDKAASVFAFIARERKVQLMAFVQFAFGFYMVSGL
jgi:hypothetical protein